VQDSREAHSDFLDPAGLADDFDIHGRAADLAVLDRGVIALRGIGIRGDDFPAMRALDLDFDKHA
jgi:hypothetical protein